MMSTRPRIPAFPCRALAVLLACASLFLVGRPVTAQPSLDPSKLIDGLSDRGMSELLLHLAETGEFDDPTQPLLIRIAQHRLRFRDAALPLADRLAAVRGARESLETLINDPRFAGHPQRPVWRTELAELLIGVYLESFKQSATAFYEFGVATDEQRQAFEYAIPLAAGHMLAAHGEFMDLDNRLAHDAALRDRLEASLALHRIHHDYRDQKSPYFSAYALYYATLLPDDHVFYTQLAKTPGMPDKPAEARVRLLRLAVLRLEPFLRGEVGREGVQRRARSLAGRATLALGNAAAADRDHLTAAISSSDFNLDILGAHIARALAQEAQGRAAAARTMLAELTGRSAVRDTLSYRLIVTDALHLLLLRMAEAAPEAGRAEALELAYSPYFELLHDPSLDAQRAGLRNLIFDRWASSLGEEATPRRLQALPPRVRMALAEIWRRRGVAAMQRGDAAAGEVLLGGAIAAGQTLTSRADLDPAVWAGGAYNLAFARYALRPDDLPTLLGVVELCAEVAERVPDQAVATDALELAGRIVEPLHRRHADQPEVVAAFDRVMGVLYGSGRFDVTRPADDRLVYYAFAAFQSKGDYAEAAALYDRQTLNHPNYLEAQSQRLHCLTQVFARSSGQAREAAKQELTSSASRVTELAQRVGDQPADGYQKASAQRALAHARLAQAEVLAAGGQLEEALRWLEDFENVFPERPEMVRQGLERRILLRVEADQLGLAQDDAGTMMGRFPDAAAGVIDNVLGDLERRIEALGDGSPEAARLADAAASMAKLLTDWAHTQGFTPQQMLPYHLVVLRSLRIAERPDEALDYLTDTGIEAAFPTNAELLFEKARVLIGKGDEASMRAAAPLLNTILTGLREPFPPVYWQAWVARLRINLALDERVDEVPRHIRQLASRHPDLGGEPYRTQLGELESRAEGRGLKVEGGN